MSGNANRPWQIGWIGPVLWAICIVSVVSAALHAYKNPEWNLDGIFYSALMRRDTESTQAMHAGVYAAIEQQAPRAAFKPLISGSSYRRQLRASADVFELQLPFYQSKPLYRWLGRGLTLVGLSSVRAPYLVSAFSFALVAVLLPLLAVRAGSRPRAAALLAAVAPWTPPFFELGALATPDALATLLVIAGALASLRNAGLAMLPLSAAVLARPDCALLGLGVMTSSGLRDAGPNRLRAAFAAGVLLCLLGASVLAATGGYGWSTVVRHTFLGSIVDRSGLVPGLDVSDYFKALGRGLRGHMTKHVSSVFFFLCMAGAGWWAYVKRERPSALRPTSLLVAGVWTASLVRFLAVPLLADRLLACAYLCSLAQICAVVAPTSRGPDSLHHKPDSRIARA